MYIFSLISFIGLLSYYIIFARIKKASFDCENTFFDEPISIVVCAKNELNNIKEFFPYWINQKYTDFELIIVNDESTDGSYEFLTELEQKYKQLTVIHINRAKDVDPSISELKGKRYALRKGILAANNDFVLLTDADCKPASNYWITEMVKAFSDKSIEIVLGYSPYFKHKGLLNFLIRLETYFTAFHYFGFANIGLPYMGVGRNIAYRKSILEDEIFLKSNLSISGDDDLVVQQLATNNNTAYTLAPKSFIFSIPSKSYKEWFAQKKRHLGAGVYYTTNIKLILNFFPILNVSFLIFLFFTYPLGIGILLMYLVLIFFIFFINKKMIV